MVGVVSIKNYKYMAELKRAKIATNEEVDVFLKGTDPQERIINIECGYDDRQATVIYRDENGVKHYDLHDFYPFCWAKQEAGRLMFDGDRTMLRMKMQEYGISCKGLIVANEKGEVPERMENGYRVMFFATRPMSNTTFTRFFDEAKVPLRPNEKHKTYGKRLYLTVAPEEQFMMATGKRLFKGYDSYDDLVRFSFDLETEGLEARKRDHKISQFGYRTNKGFEKIITVEGDGEEKRVNEMKAMREFFKDLGEIDPDIVTGYNTENFDWEFMNARAEIDEESSLGDVSKNDLLPHGVYKKNKPQILKLGGEMEHYYPTVMWGKHITDCLFSVRRAQALDSNMKKATLKYVTKYSKIAKKNRVYLPGKIINTTWADLEKAYAFNDDNGDWYRTSDAKPLKDGYELVTGRYIAERYLLDDLWETDKVELRYNESNFLVGKMLPVKFQRMCTMGTATIWKYIMMAWSYEHDLAIPLETSSRSFTGGLSRLLTVGYIPNVQKLDYNSLYPSIILTFGIKTPIDISGAMPAMLNYVLTQREYFKELKNKYDKESKKYKKQYEDNIERLRQADEYVGLDEAAFNDAISDNETLTILINKRDEAAALSVRNDKMQLPLKITGNAYFGSFGAGGGVFQWSDIDCAEETTCCGRQMLRLMLKWFSDIGYEGIVCDSVTGDTPLFIKCNGLISIKPIEKLFGNVGIDKYTDGREYDRNDKDYEVLCRSGWVKPSYFYRHETNKDMYRVDDPETNVTVDVTKDHSLFDENRNEIKPEQINKDTKLEYYNGESIFVFNTVTVPDDVILKTVMDLKFKQINEIPDEILNATIECKEKFLKTLFLTDTQIMLERYNKTIVAGVNYIKNAIIRNGGEG